MSKIVEIQDSQKESQPDIIVKTDAEALLSQIIFDSQEVFSEVMNLSMINRLIRRAPVPKNKKLFKEIKAHAVEASEKLLVLLMSQKIESITVKNILDASSLVHQMIFQNLPRELEEEAVVSEKNEKVQVLSEALIPKHEKEILNKL